MRIRLYFDENLSPALLGNLADLFPGSGIVRDLQLSSAQDAEMRSRAAEGGFAIVTKDEDFRERCFLCGSPPKAISLRIGNCRREDSAAVPCFAP